MQQRQLRLGDILDDYCPRERRLTNHSVVAMIGDEVKRTRCNTCEAEHEYKQAKVPRQRKKGEEPAALYAQVVASGPKRVAHETPDAANTAPQRNQDGSGSAAKLANEPDDESQSEDLDHQLALDADRSDGQQGDRGDLGDESGDPDEPGDIEETGEEGPVHRPLIRATLPRHEGQVPPSRPTPDFTIRQPAGRNRFRPRNQRGGGFAFQGNRPGQPGGGGGGRGPGRQEGNRPPQGNSRPQRRHDSGRKRSK